MRSDSMYRSKRGKGTGHRTGITVAEQRRLLQLGISVVVFVLALLGRSVAPQKSENWKYYLSGDIRLKEALANFENATMRGEPFMDALGELCIEVVTAESGARSEIQREQVSEQVTTDWSERRKSWNEFRESQWHIK